MKKEEKTNGELRILKGIEFSGNAFNFKKLGDLLYHEGPLLSHLFNDKDEDFLIKWCDKDTQHHRWMIFKTNSSLLHDFFHQKLNLQDLIFQNPDQFVYFVDIASGAVWKRFFLVGIKDVPAKYLPFQNSFYGDTRFEPYAEELKSYLEYHFARQEKRYAPIEETAAALVMEPNTPYQTKK